MSHGQDYNPLTVKPSVVVCDGCGCVVADTDQHDLWHRKTRSTV